MKGFVVFFGLLVSVLGCDPHDVPNDVPKCVKNLVDKNPQPKEVWRYTYQDEIVYLIVPDCCDQYIAVYAADCNWICAPSGGITGNGDGKCAEFFQQATGGTLLWKAE